MALSPLAAPGGAAAPANRADWNAVDRQAREGQAKIQTDSAARDDANIDKAARRKATFDKCKARKDEAGANSGGSTLEAFRNCLKEAQP